MTFLAMPRSKVVAGAKDAAFSMKLAYLFMITMTVLFGLGASFIIRELTKISGYVFDIDTGSIIFSLNNWTLTLPHNKGVYLSTPLIVLFLIIIVIFYICVYFLTGKRKMVLYRTWDCGYYNLDSRTEYTATAFSKPFRIAFNFFLLPYSKTEKIRDSFYHVQSFKYEVYTTPIFRRYVYDPIISSVLFIAKKARKIQSGSIHIYLAYIVITIAALIFFYL